MDRSDLASNLKGQSRFGAVGYFGDSHAPAFGTYPGINERSLDFLSSEDSGGADLAVTGAATVRLILGCMWEAMFAWETHTPLTTWHN